MPYREFLELDDRGVSLDGSVLIFSSARSGSTLLAQILGALGRFSSYSEPDYLCSLLAVARRSPQVALSIFRAATAHWMLRGPAGGRVALKPRAFAMSMPHLFAQAAPSMKRIFIYRECFASVESAVRLWPGPAVLTPAMVEQYRTQIGHALPLLESASVDALLPLGPYLGQFLLWCVSVDQACRQAHRYGIVSVRYEDLCARPRNVIEELAARLEVDGGTLSAALAVMGRPSQRGSGLRNHAPPVRIPSEVRRHMSRLLADHTRIGAPDGAVPGTI
jgi:hypothetical protein